MFGEPTRHDSSTESSDEEEEEAKSKISKILKKEDSIEDSSRKRLNDNKKIVKREHSSSGPPVVHLKIDSDSRNQSSLLQCDESSVGSIDTCSLASSCDTNSLTRQKRKRRTHAEAFIHDNLDYYKFEIPGSRLRFQGSILPPTFTHIENKATCTSNTKDNKQTGSLPNNTKLDFAVKGGKATCNGAHSKIVTCSNEMSNEKEKIVHSQEETKEKLVGESENKSGKRQEKDDDRREEHDEPYIKDSVENELPSTTDRLHFSFEVVPQCEPWYQTYTRQDVGEEFYAYSCMSDACYWKSFLLPYELPSMDSLFSGNVGGGIGSSGIRRRRNRFAHMLDKKPRKSPRCHASTLAILSSLMHHRRRKEPDKPKEESQKSETSIANSSEEDTTSGEASNANKDASNSSLTTSPVSAVHTEPATVSTTNPDCKSESTPDLQEIARNIDKMLGVGCEGEEVSSSDTGASGDESKLEANVSQKSDNKNRKSSLGKKVVHQNKKSSSSKVKKLDADLIKQNEMLEVDPSVLEELTIETSVGSIGEYNEKRCRGGPKMDVVTLLDEFSSCHCMEEAAMIHKDSTLYLNPSLLMAESSCNSSECGASSTCETLTFSDGPEGRILKIRGRKRKRKKNLTGWPADKQRLKKRLMGKVNRIDENVPSADEVTAKSVKVSDKLHSSGEENIATASSVKYEGGCGVTVETIGSQDKSSEKSDRIGVCREDSNYNLGNTVKNSARGNGGPSSVQEKRASVLSRTDSVDSSGGHSSSEYQPCVRVTKIPDITGVTVASLPISPSSSYYVAGVSNNRRLRSSSLSSSSPSTSVPVKMRSPSLSSDVLKRPVGSSPSRRRASPRKCHLRSSLQWITWSARKRR